MARNNFKVATTENGKTPKQDNKHTFATANTKKDKTPSGKTKTAKSKEELRKKREEEYKNFRIKAFVRRCERMKIPEEEAKKYVGKLVEQLEAPHKYAIHVLFNQRMIQAEKKQASTLAQEAILNAKIEYKYLTKQWAYIIGDDKVLAKLREILPGYATIHPHVLKEEPILPVSPPKEKKPSNNSKDIAAKAKAARKAGKIAYFKDRSNHKRGKSWAKVQKLKKLSDHRKAAKAKIVKTTNKKPSNGLKKASKELKQAA